MLLKVFSYTLTGAAAATALPGGRYLRLLSADADVDIEFFGADGTSLGSAIGVRGGFALGPDDLKELTGDAKASAFSLVRISSATTQAVSVVISRVPIHYDRITGSVTANVASGATLTQSTVTVGSASGALLAANANRARAWVKNTSVTETVYVCDDGTTATTSHFPIGPGECQSVESQDGLNAIRGASTDVVVRILEERA